MFDMNNNAVFTDDGYDGYDSREEILHDEIKQFFRPRP